MNFYTKAGWLDIPAVAAFCDKHGINFVLIIGKRQVGKSYGVLKYQLDEDRRFILMRRTGKELGVIAKGINSPFEAIDGYENRVILKGSADDSTMEIELLDEMYDNPKPIGLAVGLNTIANIRGFSGVKYTDWVYDECIPESHVYKIPYEDEAFLNAHVTINGNRELKGLPPVRCWLLANSNKLDCAILKALKLTDIVEKMSVNGEEWRLLKDRGIMIFLPESREVTEKRKTTALYRAIDGENEFTRMSLENEFSHNDFTDVGRTDLRQYKPLAVVGGAVLHKHKSKPLLYLTREYGRVDVPVYDNTDYCKNRFIKEFPNVRAFYLRGRMIFADATLKYNFLDYIGMN